MPSDSSSSNKSGAKRPPQPQELSANQTPSFEYLVPISVAVSASSSCSTNSSSSQQQPSINEQPLVEALSWALLHKATGEMEWKRTLDCRAKSAPANKSQDSAHSAALAGALKELEKSLEGKKFMIVACGPFHLRQHLHPIARRLNVELGPPFERYVDLLKEFDRWSASTATKARPEVLPGCAIETPQPLQAKQEHNNSNGQVQQLGAGTRRRLEEILKCK